MDENIFIEKTGSSMRCGYSETRSRPSPLESKDQCPSIGVLFLPFLLPFPRRRGRYVYLQISIPTAHCTPRTGIPRNTYFDLNWVFSHGLCKVMGTQLPTMSMLLRYREFQHSATAHCPTIQVQFLSPKLLNSLNPKLMEVFNIKYQELDRSTHSPSCEDRKQDRDTCLCPYPS